MDEETRQEEIIVDEGISRERLDKFLTRLLPQTRQWIQKRITGQQILLNGKPTKSGALVSAGDLILMAEAPEQTEYLTPHPLPLTILHEDDSLVVLDKQAGLVVHPGAGVREPTLVEGLLYHFGRKTRLEVQGQDNRPGVVHRLDKDTTGVMVCAKTPEAHQKLAVQFAEKSNVREYLALLAGRFPEEEMVYESYLGRDPKNRVKMMSRSEESFDEAGPPAGWRSAKSAFRVVRRIEVAGQALTLCKVRLFTGRTHQIRAHAEALGFPVWGDQTYKGIDKPVAVLSGGSKIEKMLMGVKRQMLHARFLGFTHPTTKEKMMFEADLPKDFQLILEAVLENSYDQ